MVFPQPIVYGVPMSRLLCLSIAVAVTLLSVAAQAAPPAKKAKPVWHGYGFLPGYHQPPSNSVPVYGAKGANRGTPDYTPSYWYNGERYYYGQPGFYRGRYNGGSFGPCWTWTPIGPAWNCG
jgi:hypothetical protein